MARKTNIEDDPREDSSHIVCIVKPSVTAQPISYLRIGIFCEPAFEYDACEVSETVRGPIPHARSVLLTLRVRSTLPSRAGLGGRVSTGLLHTLCKSLQHEYLRTKCLCKGLVQGSRVHRTNENRRDKPGGS